MNKKATKGGNGNMLLFAGLGVGALLLFGNKSGAQTPAPSALPADGQDAASIPDAPKILAVNSSSTESPTPTGIVSDEDGMEIANSQSAASNSESRAGGSTQADDDYLDYDIPAVKPAAHAGGKTPATTPAGRTIPAIVSTPLTPKEKAIIDSGKVTATLALKRPDLYKAAYVKKYGGKTTAGKRKALAAATLAIDAAVKAAQAAKGGALIKAGKYPARPEHTFIQTAGGMVSQAAVKQIADLQKAGITVSPAAQKVSAQLTAAKAAKGRYKAKSGQPHPAKRPASPSKKRNAPKHR